MIACAFCMRPRAPWGECEECGAIRVATSEHTIRCIVAQLRRRHEGAEAAGVNRIINKLAGDVIEELTERVKAAEMRNEMEVRT